MIKRAAAATLACLFLIGGVYAGAYGFRSLETNPFLSPSYSDRFQDALMGPYQLPLTENDAIFYFTTVMSEEWDLDELAGGGSLPWIQNGRTEIQASFVGKNLSLTAFSSTYFADRRPGGISVYDIWNTLGIQLDWGMQFGWFSLGITMEGGSEMIRNDIAVTDWINAMENAYFSSFRHASDRDFFSLGFGMAADAGIFSIAVKADDLITLRDEDIYIGWDAIIDSLSLSVALRYPEFTKRGDLNLVRPRMSWTLSGNPAEHDMQTAFKGELLFQLLPELDLSVALGYRETKHGWFDFDPMNGLFMTGFSVLGESFGVTVLFNVATGDWRTFSPAISFTWAR